MEADTTATLARHPPAEVARQVSSQARVQRPARRFPALAAALVPALAASSASSSSPPTPPSP